MKKVFILTLVLMLTLVGCGESTTQEATQDAVVADAPAVAETEEPVEEEPVEEEPAEEVTEEEPAEETSTGANGFGDTFKVGDFEITVKSAEIVESEEYGKTLKVVYDWTNNSEETTSPFVVIMVKGFQNGSSAETVFDYSIINSDIEMKEARPGGTVADVEVGFQLSDDSVVELDFEDYLNFDGETVTITIDPSSL